MQILFFLLSALALLTAAVSLGLTIQEKKQSKKRDTAVIQYADQAARSQAEALAERVKKLEDGVTPDYAQARAAADAVNDFNRGITNILSFDPLEALRKERNREGE